MQFLSWTFTKGRLRAIAQHDEGQDCIEAKKGFGYFRSDLSSSSCGFDSADSGADMASSMTRCFGFGSSGI